MYRRSFACLLSNSINIISKFNVSKNLRNNIGLCLSFLVKIISKKKMKFVHGHQIDPPTWNLNLFFYFFTNLYFSPYHSDVEMTHLSYVTIKPHIFSYSTKQIFDLMCKRNIDNKWGVWIPINISLSWNFLFICLFSVMPI